MKKIYLLALAVILTAVNSSAYTVDELLANGGWAISKFYGNVLSGSNKLVACWGTHIAKVDDKHVKFDTGFYNGLHVFTFELVKNDVVTNNGDQLRIYWENVASSGFKLLAGTLYSATTYDFRYYSDYAYYDIVKNNDGTFSLISTDPHCLSDPNSLNAQYYYIFDKIEFDLYDANANASHTNNTISSYTAGTRRNNTISSCTKGSSKVESFPMQMIVDRKNNTFSCINLGNRGYAVNKSNRNVAVTGTINFSNGDVTFTDLQYARVDDQWGSTTGWGTASASFKGFFYYYLSGITFASTPTFTSLYGKFKESDKPMHNDAPHGWVSNGGQRRTQINCEMTVDPWIYYTTSSSTGYKDIYANYYTNTKIEWVDDVTLQSDLDIKAYGADSESIYLQADISTLENGERLDDYDLYVIPGHYSSVLDENFIHHAEHGHLHGFKLDIDKYTTGFNKTLSMKAAPEKLDGASVNILIPMADIPVKNDENKYSFYLKAKYLDESELTPTFHALSAFGGTWTSIEDIMCNDLSERNEDVIFNMQGVRVAGMTAPGLYIVNGKKVLKK